MEEATTTTLPDVLCGDANQDGAIKTADALIALKTAVGSATCELWICDVDGSGSVTSGDALAILRLALGQPVETNCPETMPASTVPATSTTLADEGMGP